MTLQRRLCAAAAAALVASCTVAAAAATVPVIYPARNQSAAQTDRDKLACYDWSRAQSGFDPLQARPAPAQASAPSSKSADGSLVKGAAGGAAVAELTQGDVGQGAAIGLIGAGVRERAKEQQARQQQAAQQQQQAQQQQAALAQGKAQFDRGFAACMEARGYVVK